MSEKSNIPELSVLDEIRSTIASIDALREKPTPASSEAAPAAPPQPELKPEPVAPPAASVKPQKTKVSTVQPSISLDSISLKTLQDSIRVTKKPEQPPAENDSPTAASPAKPQPAIQPESKSVGGTVEPPESDDPVKKFIPPDTTVSLRSANLDAKIMIVDDEPLNVMTFRQHLKTEGYRNFVTTEDPRQALVLLRDERPDVLLLDIHMPEITGMDIMRVVGLDPQLQHIPVLILTADTDPATRRKCLDLGASDFLSKPIDPNELIPRVRNAVTLKTHFDMVTDEAARLEKEVERRTRQLEATRQQLIISLARAAEHRDNDTGNHVIRVGRYTSIIAEGLGYPKSKLQMLEQAAQLHDVGKIGIPDAILFKPGKLEPDEYDLMKRHCSLGKQIIEPISDKDWEVLQTHTRKGESLLHVRSSPLLMLAARIAQTHHEKWDGSGYPLGLAGEDIPIEGRMVAVADVFDALSSERPYKKPFSREKCFEILEEGRGTHFDPNVLDSFMNQADRIIETQLSLMDDEEQIDITQYS